MTMVGQLNSFNGSISAENSTTPIPFHSTITKYFTQQNCLYFLNLSKQKNCPATGSDD